MPRVLLRVLPVMLLLACGGGGGDPVTPPPVLAALSVSALNDTMVPDVRQQLSVQGTAANGAVIPDVQVAWVSSNSNVATVSASGEVLARGVGPVTITAAARGVQGTRSFTVLAGGLVGAAGDTLIPNQTVTLGVPAGALSSDTPISVVPLPPLPDTGSVARALSGTLHEFGPDGTAFALPVTLSLRYEPGALPTGLTAADLRVAQLKPEGWEILQEGAAFNAATRTVSATVRHFSTYALVPNACE